MCPRVCPGVSVTTNLVAAETETIAALHGLVEPRNGPGVVGGSDNSRAGALLDLGVAAGVVAVMMGGEDVAELPAALLEGGGNGAGMGDIDRRGKPGVGIVHQNAEVVFKTGKLEDFEVGHGQSHAGAGYFPPRVHALAEPALDRV